MTASRYKDTKIYDDGAGRYKQGPWMPPPEFSEIGDDWETHVVRENEVGFLDILAVRYFGLNREELWWAIARANGLINIEAEMSPGMKLRIPPRAVVDAYVARTSYATATA